MEWQETSKGFYKIERNKTVVRLCFTKNTANQTFDVQRFEFKTENASKEFYNLLLESLEKKTHEMKI